MGHKNLCLLLIMLFVFIPGQVVLSGGAGEAMEIHLLLTPLVEDPTSERFATELPPDSMEGLRIVVTGERRTPGPLPRQRNPELSPQHLVVIAFDTQGQEITRLIIADPRLVRAESVGPSGELISSKDFFHKSVEFSVVLPDDPQITGLKFYHPRWTGTDFILELIAETQLP